MSRIADLRKLAERNRGSIAWAVKRIERADLEGAVSRVWTLAGCLAVVVERPQEDLLREVTGIDTLDRRADLYTLTLAGLERCAELLEQAHMQAVCELEARPNDDARLP
jgi:hypothetical protein